MQQWFDLNKDKQEAVLSRIATALKAKKLPHLDDAVLFQQSVLIHHDKKNDDAGYRLKATKKQDSPLPKLGEKALYDQVIIVTEFLISPKMPPEALRIDFSERLLAYLERKIPRAKLLGTKYQSTFTPQFRYLIGDLADLARRNIRRNSDKGDYRRLPEELSTHKTCGDLFELLAELAGESSISDLVEEFQLAEGAAVTLQTIDRQIKAAISKPQPTKVDIELLKNIHTWAKCYYDRKEHQNALQEYLEHQKKELSKPRKIDSPN